MAFKRNAGRFIHKIELYKPSTTTRDELGGMNTSTPILAGTLFAMCEQKNQTRQQVIGDYVSVATRYFVVRDIRTLHPDIDTTWTLKYNGITYAINDLSLIEETPPYYVQITATAVNAGGGIV